MTRIIAGAAGGLRLQVPRSGTRPTSDRVREALFSALDARGVVRGARVLDLYAGSGALGLEAASRGAASATLVERAPAAAAIARANAARLRDAGVSAPVHVVAQEVRRFLTGAAGPFDLVLVDPPYELDAAELSTELASLVPLLAAEGVVVVERSARAADPAWPEGLEAERRSAYGETALHWLRPAESAGR